MTLVSVLMPVFNAELFLEKSVDSILAQSFEDFELIIINDGSTDSTLDIINTFNDSRIKLINKERNEGYVKALNDGIKIAYGEFIARLDADDFSYPKRLEKQYEFLRENPGVGLVSSYVVDFEDNAILNSSDNSEKLKFSFLVKNPFVHSSVMFRNEIIKKYNLNYDEELTYAEDYKLWFEFSKWSDFAVIPMVLTTYRKHNGQVSNRFKATQIQRFWAINFEIWEYYLNRKLIEREKEIIQYAVKYRKDMIILLNEIAEKYSKRPVLSDFLTFYCRQILKLKGLDKFEIFQISQISILQKVKFLINYKNS